MRHENQRWNVIRATTEIVVGGVGTTGLAPTVGIKRISDGNWLATGGASWAAGFATNPMVAADVTNLPGLYQYIIPPAQLAAYTASDPGYLLVVTETTNNIREHIFVHPAKDPWEELTADHVSAGSFGLAAAAVAPTSAAVADAVWDEATAAHVSAGSFGLAAAHASAPTAASVADAVWDEATSAHTSAGSFGLAAAHASAPTASVVADAVWDEVRSGHVAAGSFGEGVLVESVKADAINAASLATDAVAEVATAILGAALTDHTDDTTIAGAISRILGLENHNNRVVYSSWNTDGQADAGIVYLYANKADADAASATPTLAMTGSYSFTATHDSLGRLTEFVSTRES